MIDPQVAFASHLVYLLISVMEFQQIAPSLFLVDFTLENQIAALSTCLPPSVAWGLSSDYHQMGSPPSVLPFLCRRRLSGAGVEPWVQPHQPGWGCVENEEM